MKLPEVAPLPVMETVLVNTGVVLQDESEKTLKVMDPVGLEPPIMVAVSDAEDPITMIDDKSEVEIVGEYLATVTSTAGKAKE